MTTMAALDHFILQIDASGAPVRFEYVRGRMKWEMSPASRHQMMIDRIRAGLRPSAVQGSECACVSLADVLIRFSDADQSLKRPDIAIFCSQPPAVDEALDMLPSAVIEVISVGYEEKDTGPDGAPFYIAQGVQDVLVVDPRSGQVQHYQTDIPMQHYPTPRAFDLRCGCRVQIPSLVLGMSPGVPYYPFTLSSMADTNTFE